jgi:hypothetical protein
MQTEAATSVIAVQQPFTLLRHERMQPLFPLDHRRVSQILAIAPEQIECNEARFASRRNRRSRNCGFLPQCCNRVHAAGAASRQVRRCEPAQLVISDFAPIDLIALRICSLLPWPRHRQTERTRLEVWPPTNHTLTIDNTYCR